MSTECFMRRLWAKTDRTNHHGCWIWQGKTLPTGYGQIGNHRHSEYVHRAAYIAFVGDLPASNRVTVDHLCGNRSCCNPDHLEMVNHQENIARSGEVVLTGGDCGIPKCWHCIVTHRDGVEPERRSRRPKSEVGCIVADCDRAHHARGLCHFHYERSRTSDEFADLRREATA